MKTRKTVLIIEDNNDVRDMYRICFENAGFDVLVCENGLEGITTIVEKTPHVVLLDIMMPEMNGYDFLKALNENTSIDVPVVVASNLGQGVDKQKAIAAGADLYIVKSNYSAPELVNMVIDFLETQ